MSILTWIEDKKRLKILAAPKQHHKVADSSKGLWTRCDKCGVILYIKHLKENQRVCFGCSYHLQMMSGERIETLLDRVPVSSSLPVKKSVKPLQDSYSYKTLNKASLCNTKQRFRKGDTRPGVLRDNTVSTWRPLDETLSPCDPLSFHDQKAYGARLEDAQERTGLQDAIQTGTGMIDGIPVALAVMDFSFMGGSMGSVVGEKITRLIEYATGEGLTLIIVSASGGARMQEGVFSLMQMAKISSALQIYQMCARLLYISILTSPTTGGVTASFAMLGDIIFAEPKALIAFAGRRVIEQTLREDLPDDFQTSEYMLHHGLVDLIVPRRFLRQALSETIRLYQNAPFKKRGQIPFGVQNPITFLAEEKVRRQWGTLTKRGTKPVDLGDSSNPVYKTMQGVQVQSSVNKALPCKQGSLYALQNKFCTKGVWAPTTYREILTSFEIMLSLFVSGNSKKIEKTGYSSKKGRDPKTVATANRSLKALQKQFLHGSLGGVSSFAQIKSFHKRLCTALQLQSLYKAPLCKNLSCKADKATLCSRKHSLGNRAVASQSSALLARLTPTNPRFVRSFAQLCNANNGFATKKLFVSKKPRQERKDENGSIPISEVETKSRPLQSGALLEGAGSANKHTITNQRFVRSFVSRRKTRFCQPGRQTFLGNSTEDLFSNSDQVSRSGLLHSFRFFSEGAQVSRPYNRLRGSKEKLSVQTLLQLQIKDLLKALCAKRYKTGLGKGVQIYRNGCKKLSKRAETSFNELTNSFFGGLQSSALYAAGPFGQKTKPLGAGGFAAKRNNNGAFDEDSSWGQNHCKSSVAKRFVKSFVTASDKRDSVSRREKEFFLKSSKASKKSVTSAKNDINFLNQAIELAATESVEWRAFYIHQQLSENMGFLEDFLQQDPDSRRKTNNVLFYKSVCRSKKALDE